MWCDSQLRAGLDPIYLPYILTNSCVQIKSFFPILTSSGVQIKSFFPILTSSGVIQT